MALDASYKMFLARNACKIIASMSPCPVPSSTLSAASSVGANVISVSDPSRFLARSVLSIWDGTDEFQCLVKSVSGSNVTLDFTGQINPDGTAKTGLTYAHASGTPVTTNLMPFALQASGQMLVADQPAIGCYPMDTISDAKGAFYVPLVQLRVQYQIRSVQNTGTRVQSILFEGQQQERCVTDTEAIEMTFAAYQRMNGASVMINRMLNTLRRTEVNADAPRFEVWLDCVVRTPDINMPRQLG